ncbi:MAG: DNA mismatch repair protein MutS [Spirochaetaceae bacterium]|jgi:DNA mismatch repair protein MutS|nr:DNA mismatch repair protein MutS [Spirochaetaceae bacterium]
MLAQYRRIKQKHTEDVLFFRLGDFYEMFAEDALEVSALLNLTLTSRNGLPMCGVPFHSARSYIARLLKAGKKIAICEQLGGAQKGKSLIERDVVEVITPGTTVDEDLLEKGDPNYLASLCRCAGALSFAYIDLSTGDFHAASFAAEGGGMRLREELERLSLKELIVQESLIKENSEVSRALLERSGLLLNRWTDWLFDRQKSEARLRRQFGTENLKGFGIDDSSPEILAAGALLDYIDETAKSRLKHISRICIDREADSVGIDEASQRNLELVRAMISGDVRCSLLAVMDETKTAMGRRLFKQRLTHPLRSLEKIEARLAAVDIFYHHQAALTPLREALGRTPDLERQCSRLAMGRSHGKDLLSLRNALFQFGQIEGGGDGVNAAWIIQFESDEARNFDEAARIKLLGLKDLLERGLADEPSILLSEGKLIKNGFHAELDRLHSLRDNGRSLLEAYLEEERRNTGISSLKIKYNRLIGYFFEVTNVHKEKVPSHFIRRQGILGGERFTTDRLIELESDMNGAQDKIIELERTLFLELRDTAAALIPELNAAAHRIAEIDVAAGLAAAATIHCWNKPQVNGTKRLRIIEGRHPVVESLLPRGEFIPNDTILDAEPTPDSFASAAPDTFASAVPDTLPSVPDTFASAMPDTLPPVPESAMQEATLQNTGTSSPTPVSSAERKGAKIFALITGPNMAGKSTYLRQSALIVIMAQMGSFVPASEAEIGITDRIFCRVGAQDNLARGESTFLVEMNETAFILNTATDMSLVIMDEVGRGTGTLDGLSIARSVCDELLTRIQCRTLFATHYHELVGMKHERLVNRSLEVDESGGQIIFRRRLVEGPSADSYGLQVARLAGLPTAVLERAALYLSELKAKAAADNREREGKQKNDEREVPKTEAAEKENPLFRQVIDELSALDLDNITPVEAINSILQWKKALSGDVPVKKRKSISPRPASSPPPTPPKKNEALLFDV